MEFISPILDAINHGRIPTIESAWDYVCESQTRDEADVALMQYE